MVKYNHSEIEKKWQKIWEEKEFFKVEVDPSKPKYYILDMFPFPSGAGLHVGHVTGYTATDIVARYKRQMGFNVLHPMGWDSFGLPAEQYAVRTGTHPSITTEKNVATYKRQLKEVGFSYDWSREFATTDPGYYKWTQWIFTKLYEKGLAYEAEALVNYCPKLGTVLANEEIENGKSKVGGYPVERRPLRQWILKITAYAEQLLEGLDALDWPEYLKNLQRNWIGKSVGAKVHFSTESGERITVFTTRHDTIFGTTFLVLAPEHPLVNKITTPEQKEAVLTYQKDVASKSDLERTDLAKIKTGVFTGAYAINPINGEKVPVWVADYVLMGYGTGAVMGVPGDDERDREFITKYNLPLIEIIDAEGKIINSDFLNGLPWKEALDVVTKWLEDHGHGEKCVNYKLRDWLFSRQRYWGEPFPILHFEDGTKRALDLDELPLTLPDLQDFGPSESGESPLAKVPSWLHIVDPKTGKKALRETNTMPNWAGSCWYYLRFVDPHNTQAAWGKEKENYWMPVDLYVGGVEHAVLHLLYARFWHKVLFDLGLVSTSEPFQALRNQGLVTAEAYKHQDGHYVATEEVFKRGEHYFQIGTEAKLTSSVEKMSKSKLNGITPDEMIEEVGADALRLYEMFMAPFEKEKLWNSDSASGCKRFLNRFWDLVHSEKITDDESEEALKLGHRLVHGVQHDIEGLYFNTAIAKMMEFLNAFIPLEKHPRSILKMAVQCLYPFAPHIAEEMWEILGGKESLTFVPFPKVHPQYLEDDTVTFVVQVNGKLRGNWEMPKGKSKEEMLTFAKGQPGVQKHLTQNIVKVIHIPNKLLNIVCKP